MLLAVKMRYRRFYIRNGKNYYNDYIAQCDICILSVNVSIPISGAKKFFKSS
jgi:hypothetical protein